VGLGELLDLKGIKSWSLGCQRYRAINSHMEV